jgi:hypothetical protein
LSRFAKIETAALGAFQTSIMAAKNTTTPAPAAEKGSGAAQIMQNLTTILSIVEELKKNSVATTEGLKAIAASQVKLENEVSNMRTEVKSSAAQKRAPKPPAGENGGANGSSTSATSTVPSGEKYPSTSFIWFGLNYKRDPEGTAAKYVTEAHVKEVRDKLASDENYKKHDVNSGTAEAREKAKQERLTMEAKSLINEVIKKDNAIVEKLKADWTQGKSDFEKRNRTGATKDAETSAASQ